jgi:hypothetical protein
MLLLSASREETGISNMLQVRRASMWFKSSPSRCDSSPVLQCDGCARRCHAGGEAGRVRAWRMRGAVGSGLREPWWRGRRPQRRPRFSKISTGFWIPPLKFKFYPKFWKVPIRKIVPYLIPFKYIYYLKFLEREKSNFWSNQFKLVWKSFE